MNTDAFWAFCLHVAVLSYLLGSCNFAIILSKIFKKDDVRNHGSGNAGMTNILRTYGKKAAFFTALGDFSKAVIAVQLARYLFDFGGIEPVCDPGYIAGLFVLLGHVFPLYFGFKGGKGVMTTLGVLFMVNPIVFLIICVIFVPLIFITRIVSLGSVCGAIAYPIVTFAVRLLQGRPDVFETVCTIITGGLVLYVHRSNIKRLLNGTENRFEPKKKKK